MSTKGDFCLLPKQDPHYVKQMLVECRAGDLILWDSRTVHGGLVGKGVARPPPPSARGEVPSAGVRIAKAAPAPAVAEVEAEEERSKGPMKGGEGGGEGGEKEKAGAEEAWRRWRRGLARLSVTVCMTAASRATAETLAARVAGFEAGRSFNHTPHEAGTSSGTLRSPRDPTYRPCALTPLQRSLLNGKPPSSPPL